MNTVILTADQARRRVEAHVGREIAPDRWSRFLRKQGIGIGQVAGGRRLFVESDVPRLVERFREAVSKTSSTRLATA